MLTPERRASGKWAVGDREFETNAQAWRFIDRTNNEPVSRAEDLADWISNKETKGE